MYSEIDSIKSKLVDRIILIMLIFLTPPYISAILRWIEIGWHNINIVHTLLFIILVLFTVYRKKISFNIKIYSIAIFYAILGLAALWYLGFSGIHYFVIISIALVSVFTNRRIAFIFVAIIAACYITVAVIYISGKQISSVDLNSFSHSAYQWVTIILSLIAFGAVFVAGFGELNKHLESSIREKINIKHDLENHVKELERTKLKLDTTIGELQQLNATKDKLFSIVAHDLKSPLSSVQGFSSLLNEEYDKHDDAAKKRYIELIHKSVSNTYKLLKDLLIWARMQRNMIEFNPKSENLFLLTRKVLKTIKPYSKKKLVKIYNRVPEDMFVNIDDFMISTVIRNLVTNAVKYTNPGEGKIVITANEKINNLNHRLVEICVRDNGVGIPEKKQPNLFQVGENSSTSGTENEKGTGLGLLICYDFIKRHAGNIWVESEEGIGTALFFTLQG